MQYPRQDRKLDQTLKFAGAQFSCKVQYTIGVEIFASLTAI